ncbi:MAG: hypothetical protein HFG00_07465 [Oscillibacter sp.]|nr:hypothetical protein [Oscillibacter sp.]
MAHVQVSFVCFGVYYTTAAGKCKKKAQSGKITPAKLDGCKKFSPIRKQTGGKKRGNDRNWKLPAICLESEQNVKNSLQIEAVCPILYGSGIVWFFWKPAVRKKEERR